jgi:tetratricopeptide (TPR) repeat protein
VIIGAPWPEVVPVPAGPQGAGSVIVLVTTDAAVPAMPVDRLSNTLRPSSCRSRRGAVSQAGGQVAVGRPYAGLGAALMTCRMAAGLSLRVLARRIGLGAHSALVDYEQGRRLIPGDLLVRYQQLFPDQGDRLRGLWQAALASRAAAAVRDLAEPGGPAVDVAPPPRPAQLPADLPDFVGRQPETEALTAAAGGPASRLLVISGPPGVGKTSLAVHVAHRIADRFPDGHLYLELRGAGPGAAPATDALRQALRALGVASALLSGDVTELAGLYRSVMYERRMLILLDDAASEDQVRPLLPGGPGSLVVVTSRGPLGTLPTSHRCALDLLPTADTLTLLERVVGADRVAAEPDAAARIAALCAGLPLAARLAGARLATWSAAPLRDGARALSDQRRRLDWLAAGDRALRGTLEVTYQALTAPARALFRRLALLPVAECGVPAAAVLAGAPEPTAAGLLDELTAAGLIRPARTADRYRMHDLTVLYARERLRADDEAADREQAEHRLLEWLLGTTLRAAALLDLSDGTELPDGGPFGTPEDALRWLDTEHPGLRAAIRRATDLDRADLVLPLTAVLSWYHDLRCHADDQRDLAGCALLLARRHRERGQEIIALNLLALTHLDEPDRMARYAAAAVRLSRQIKATGDEAWALDRYGQALAALGDHARAVTTLHRAAALAAEYGDWWESAAALNHLGHALFDRGEYEQAAGAYRGALAIFDALGKPHSAAMSRTGLGRALAGTGRVADAAAQHRTALAAFHTADDGWGVALASAELATILRGLGDAGTAATLLRAAADLFARHGDHRRHATALADLRALPDVRGNDR